MIKRGIYLSPSGYEVGFLSTAHTESDLKKTADAFTETLELVLK
jgi:glutamate-1-semialdehyde 2,1-aminomutase